MSTATSISLFTETRLTRRGPSAVALSALLHGAAFALLSIGIILTPPIVERQHPDHYILRLLTLHSPEEQARQAAADAAKYPSEQPNTKQPAGGSPAAQQSAPKLDSLRKQTLVQPDVPPDVKLPDNVQLPQVVAWQKPKVVLKEVVPDAPKLPAASMTKPSIDVPNAEVDLADVRIASTPFVAESLALQPRTTSPIVNQADNSNNKIPETASQADKPAPAQVISLSDMNMPKGTTALPFANQLASGNGGLAPGIGKDASIGSGHGPSDAKGAGSGGSGNKPGAASGGGADAMNGTTHIRLPKDGHFGMWLVNDSLEELYPETGGMWGNRITYTVNLSMGTEKKWIMQYSLPRGEEAAQGGKTAPPEAPYPTDIVRPNLAPGEINADAILVHGFVNEDGKFEKLSISFPPEFPRAKFVIDALNQWQFRPALQLGLPTRVEILLIIPETYD